jgi:hypothetical protein
MLMMWWVVLERRMEVKWELKFMWSRMKLTLALE